MRSEQRLPELRAWGEAVLGLVAFVGSLALAAEPAALVNPLIGTTNGGNTVPGAVVPFGMVQWSPEAIPFDPKKPRPVAAPGGYEYRSKAIRGFSLTHVSGTGCAGASGDIPFMPFLGDLTDSPSAGGLGSYRSGFRHDDEAALPGYYRVLLENGVTAELSATARTGTGRFTYPATKRAGVLIRTSDSETGSTAATVAVNAAARTVSGSVTSGNFCGYIPMKGDIDRRSYYTLYFVAHFDQPFAGTGVWEDQRIQPGKTSAAGGTTFGAHGFPPSGKGSGAYVMFDVSERKAVNIRVGISYVSLENAAANLRAENPEGASLEDLRRRATAEWNGWLGRIEIEGGSQEQQTVFYTALYHSLLHMNLYSDVNGEYRGMDGKVHRITPRQRAQYANFSGWDVYRSQIQLVALLDPDVASDMAQSLLNQAGQNGGEWDRWTHNAGATHVMNGDPSAPFVAAALAFGANRFDSKAAYASLLKAASVPNANDLSDAGCEVACVGQRPSLDQWLKRHYIAAKSNSWGGAAETLEQVAADFAISELARRHGDEDNRRRFLERARYWRNLFNPDATREGGYIQNRNEDGSWPPFDPANDEGFVEASGAVYLWMVPFDPRGLFEAMGGVEKANQRLDAFFYNPDGSLAVTKSGPLHAELDNEPSVGAPWLYNYSGRPYKTQQIVREVLDKLWTSAPGGIPGNDDLGAMSSWCVWSAMGMYPAIPGRAELILASPLFSGIRIHRARGNDITIRASGASAQRFYVADLQVNGKRTSRSWLPESFVEQGGTLEYTLAAEPNREWGAGAGDEPPSFGPVGRRD